MNRPVCLSVLVLLLQRFQSAPGFAIYSPWSYRIQVVQRSPSSTPIVASSSFRSKQLYLKGDVKGLWEFLTPKKGDSIVLSPKFETVEIEPDFKPGLYLMSMGLLLDTIPYIQVTLGLFITLVGIVFIVQATRIRFVFDEDSLELATLSKDGTSLQSSGENVVVGGANRWKTSSIVQYEFFPKGWIDGPIGPLLVYFKETQTPQEFWNDGPGAIANNPEKVQAGTAIPGQVHFFPTICNAQQMRSEFVKRGCGKIE